VLVVDRVGELTDLLAAHVIRLGWWIAAAHEGGIDRHDRETIRYSGTLVSTSNGAAPIPATRGRPHRSTSQSVLATGRGDVRSTTERTPAASSAATSSDASTRPYQR